MSDLQRLARRYREERGDEVAARLCEAIETVANCPEWLVPRLRFIADALEASERERAELLVMLIQRDQKKNHSGIWPTEGSV